MKKLLLLSALLFSILANSQDVATINQLVNATSLEQVKNTSDKIAAAATNKFEYFKTADRTVTLDKYKVVVYTPKGFAPVNKDKLTPEEKEQCLLVVWLVKEDGSFIFKEVSSKAENVQPFWSNTFTASDEYRVNKDLKYKLVKQENSLSIVKSY